jgi:hypothetical protein
MEDTRFKTAEDMAVAILKVAYDTLRQKTWYAFGALYHGKPFKVYGLEATEANAWKAAEALPYRDRAIWPIHPFEEFLKDREQAVADASYVPTRECVDCGHEEWAHHFVAANGKRTHPKAANAAPRCSIDCNCERFTSEAVAAREAEQAEQAARRIARQEKAAA